ncbi:glycosyltransferase [Blastopirellula retiformator]|nr:glycosyltransferase [Blastopirellula retiformator]
MNRGILRKIAEDPDFEVTVGGPAYFHGDLRPIEFEPEPEGSQLKTVAIPTRLSKYIHLFWYQGKTLRQLVRSNDFDVVHAWEEPYIYAGYQVSQSCRDQPARYCFRTAQSLNKRYPPPFNWFEKSVLRHASGWIAGASLVHQQMLERGFSESTGTILNLAVDTTAFRPLAPEHKCQVQQALGLQGPVIGFNGRLETDKGIEILLAALEKIKHRTWSCFFMGSGRLEGMIRQWAETHELTKRIAIKLIPHSEVPDYQGAMDIMVAPSQTMPNWKEQFGRMLIEAFAAGVPVIASDSGEIPFTVGDAGIIVSEKDVDGYAAAIQRLLDDDQQRQTLIDNGLKRADHFSVNQTAERYKQFYRELASREKV